MKSDNPKQALSGFNDVLPKTIIDAILRISQRAPAFKCYSI